jgi:hypothetical protein
VNKIDSGSDRYTYYGEFGERVARLRKEILKGNLDPILGLNPTLILHGISGLRGELLPALGKDPLKGETYTRFANDPDLKTRRIFEAAHEKNLKAKEESDKIFEKLIKTLSPTANNPYTNSIVINDYKVYPLALPLEDASKFDNIPEAKPASDAENRTKKQLTHADDDSVTERKIFNGKIIRAAKPDPSETTTNIPIPDLIGIIGFTLTDTIATDMGLNKETRGVLVIGVLENSIAEKAGLRAGTPQRSSMAQTACLAETSSTASRTKPSIT